MRYAKTVNLTYGEKKALERKYKRSDNTVNLSDAEKEHIKEKYRDAYSKKPKKRKDITPMENENGDNGSFFKYAYRYYFLLDLPAREAFAKFCECMRTADKAKAAAYLLLRGESDRDGLKKSVEEATFGYSYGLSEKFEYIKKKCFGAKKGATT